MQSKSSLLLEILLCLLTINVVVAEEVCQQINIKQVITDLDISAPYLIQTDIETRPMCQQA